MDTREICAKITEELGRVLASVDPGETEAMVRLIQGADRVFVSAAGRSRLMASAFAMRLMQIGFRVYVAGEIVTPAIRPGDLLVIGSGSGNTKCLINHAQTAKSLGIPVCLVTTNRGSSIAALADQVVVIPTTTEKTANSGEQPVSLQLGGNTFEQSLLILLDAMVIRLTEDMEPGLSVMARHANLE